MRITTKSRRRLLVIAAGVSILMTPTGAALAEPTDSTGGSDSTSENTDSSTDSDTTTDNDTPSPDQEPADSADVPAPDSADAPDTSDTATGDTAKPTAPQTNPPSRRPWINDGTNHWRPRHTAPETPAPLAPTTVAPQPPNLRFPVLPAKTEPAPAPSVDDAGESNAPTRNSPPVPGPSRTDPSADETSTATTLSVHFRTTFASPALPVAPAPAPITDPATVSLGLLAFLGIPAGSTDLTAHPALWTLAWFARRTNTPLDDPSPRLDDADVSKPSGDGKTFHLVLDTVDPSREDTWTVRESPSYSTFSGEPVGSPAVASNGSIYQTTKGTNVFDNPEVNVFEIRPGLTIQETVAGTAPVGGIVVDGNTAYQLTESTTDGQDHTTILTALSSTGLNKVYSTPGQASGPIVVRDGYVYSIVDASSRVRQADGTWLQSNDFRLWVVGPAGTTGTVKVNGYALEGPFLDADGDIHVATSTQVYRYDGAVVRAAASDIAPSAE